MILEQVLCWCLRTFAPHTRGSFARTHHTACVATHRTLHYWLRAVKRFTHALFTATRTRGFYTRVDSSRLTRLFTVCVHGCWFSWLLDRWLRTRSRLHTHLLLRGLVSWLVWILRLRISAVLSVLVCTLSPARYASGSWTHASSLRLVALRSLPRFAHTHGCAPSVLPDAVRSARSPRLPWIFARFTFVLTLWLRSAFARSAVVRCVGPFSSYGSITGLFSARRSFWILIMAYALSMDGTLGCTLTRTHTINTLGYIRTDSRVCWFTPIRVFVKFAHYVDRWFCVCALHSLVVAPGSRGFFTRLT